MAEKEKGINERKKQSKLVSAVVVLGVLCAAYEGVKLLCYLTGRKKKLKRMTQA